ncbi:hypothetical protein FHS94_003924 [Sphingomonas aerophila]|uniref:Uncharacterized protein n=1 Tax=Sphingomonas aerophila TaxID=1344948 RepID=A0A7W9EW89_9SPHN|nr:hypothetical protein [Sphingomonas aerophila]
MKIINAYQHFSIAMGVPYLFAQQGDLPWTTLN